MLKKIKRFQKRCNARLHYLLAQKNRTTEGRRKRQIWIDRFWLTVKYTILAIAAAVIIRGFLLIPVPVAGNSMEPAMYQNDMIVMEKLTKIERFDVVVFQLADGKIYIKRVIGLPGDSVVYQDDQLHINGEAVDEPFLKKKQKTADRNFPYTTDFDLESLIGSETLAEDEYIVLGDNRGSSKDSRTFGTVHTDEILGKVRLVYYPLQHFKFVS